MTAIPPSEPRRAWRPKALAILAVACAYCLVRWYLVSTYLYEFPLHRAHAEEIVRLIRTGRFPIMPHGYVEMAGDLRSRAQLIWYYAYVWRDERDRLCVYITTRLPDGWLCPARGYVWRGSAPTGIVRNAPRYEGEPGQIVVSTGEQAYPAWVLGQPWPGWLHVEIRTVLLHHIPW